VTATVEKLERRRANQRAWYTRNLEKAQAQSRRHAATYRARHKEAIYARARAKWRSLTYGISPQEFQALLDQQNGMCAGGCGRPATDLDHDHETGEFRGVLCTKCNLDDVLGRNRFTDPDLTDEIADQLADLIFQELVLRLRLDMPPTRTQRYRHRQKARDLAIQTAALAALDREWEALHN
jgi:Recombination endonuclease VII